MIQRKLDWAAASAGALKAAVGGVMAWLLAVHPVYLSLTFLMVVDFITGLWAAGSTGQVDSARSREGIKRKAVQVLLVLSSEIGYRALQASSKQHGAELPNVPAGALIAGFYCAHEFISILENAGKLGVYIPKPLRAALKKLNELDDGKDA